MMMMMIKGTKEKGLVYTGTAELLASTLNWKFPWLMFFY